MFLLTSDVALHAWFLDQAMQIVGMDAQPDAPPLRLPLAKGGSKVLLDSENATVVMG